VGVCEPVVSVFGLPHQIEPPKRFHFQCDSFFILVFLIDNRKEKDIL